MRKKKMHTGDYQMLTDNMELDSGQCDSSATGTDIRNRNSRPLDASYDQN